MFAGVAFVCSGTCARALTAFSVVIIAVIRFAQVARQFSLQAVPDDTIQAAIARMRSVYVNGRQATAGFRGSFFFLLIHLVFFSTAKAILIAGLISSLKSFLSALCKLP